jgi:hypothetical protein
MPSAENRAIAAWNTRPAEDELLEALRYANRFLRETDHDTEYVESVIAKHGGTP